VALNIDHSHHSTNFSGRDGAPITLLVLHATVGSYASSLAWLCNPASKVSTHYLIRKDGHIAQLVADNLAAWHAGVSAWFDLDSGEIMRQSIGIELENRNTGVDKYPEAQMAALLELSRALVAQYKIVPDMVTRHLDVAIPKGRKTDPAGFPWLAFKAALYAPTTQTMKAGPFGAIARTDYRGGGHAAGYFGPGVSIPLDDFHENEYRHAASGIGFIAEGDLV
jgi:N-acetylmuramoyl-L-alanine amidase